MAQRQRQVKDAHLPVGSMDKRGKKVKGQLRPAANRGQFRAAASRESPSPRSGSRATCFPGSKRIHRQGCHAVHPPTGDHDESRVVPLLQSFEIVARGHSNPSMQRLLMEIKAIIEKGSSLTQAFRFAIRCTSMRCSAIWWGPVNRRAFWTGCSNGWRSTRKKSSHFKSNQVGAVLPVSIIVRWRLSSPP